MYISLPWDAVQPVEPITPVEPIAPAAPDPGKHLSPYLDPQSPKYKIPAIIFFSCVGGILLLGILFWLLWRRRHRLIERYGPLPKWLTASIAMAQKLSCPMSACLCGWLRVAGSDSSARSASAPPPYDDASSPPAPPALQLASPAAASTGRRHRATPSPPPSYPPAPPPTPDNAYPGTVAVASPSSTTSYATPPGLAPTAIAPLSSAAPLRPIRSGPAPSAPARGRFQHTIAPAAPPPGPPPAYPPPPHPELDYCADQVSVRDAHELCDVPWGSVGASTPHASSVLARCRYEA